MKFFAATALALFGAATAMPADFAPRDAPQSVTLVFQAAAAGYELKIPADGAYHPTNQPDLNVNTISFPDFNAQQCVFDIDGDADQTFRRDDQGNAFIDIGPPHPIKGVTCQGTCIPTYGDCFRNGQFLGLCCNGFCAANKCRPFAQPH